VEAVRSDLRGRIRDFWPEDPGRRDADPSPKEEERM